jgi:hypothetical protein
VGIGKKEREQTGGGWDRAGNRTGGRNKGRDHSVKEDQRVGTNGGNRGWEETEHRNRGWEENRTQEQRVGTREEIRVGEDQRVGRKQNAGIADGIGNKGWEENILL